MKNKTYNILLFIIVVLTISSLSSFIVAVICNVPYNYGLMLYITFLLYIPITSIYDKLKIKEDEQ